MFNSVGALIMRTQTGDSIIRLTAPEKPGVYIIRYTTDKQSQTYRVVVE